MTTMTCMWYSLIWRFPSTYFLFRLCSILGCSKYVIFFGHCHIGIPFVSLFHFYKFRFRIYCPRSFVSTVNGSDLMEWRTALHQTYQPFSFHLYFFEVLLQLQEKKETTEICIVFWYCCRYIYIYIFHCTNKVSIVSWVHLSGKTSI